MVVEPPVRGRNLQLDIVRGLAVLLVFGRHLEIPGTTGVVGVFGETWFKIGWVGVDLFFVLSGFLIGGLLISEFQKHGNIQIGRFLIRRGFKLYPLYFVFLLYLILVPTLKAAATGGDAGAVFLDWCKRTWANFLFLQNYFGTPAGHTWTLAVEEHFYILLPFLLVWLFKAKMQGKLWQLALFALPLILGLRIVSAVTQDQFSTTMSATHLRLDALLFGVAVRAVAAFEPQKFGEFGKRRGLLGIAAVILWCPILLLSPESIWLRTVGLSSTYLGAGALLLLCYHTNSSNSGGFFEICRPIGRLLGFIGVYSYGIYLWHVTVMGILAKSLEKYVLSGGELSAIWWMLSVCLICSGAVIAGVVLSKIIEWPALALRDKFFPSRAQSLPDPKRTSLPQEGTISVQSLEPSNSQVR